MKPFLPLVLFTLAAALTPGGATALATAAGVNAGLVRSLPLLLGLALGMAGLSAAAAGGLAAVVAASPALGLMLKAAGTLYLLWLAWVIGRRSGGGSGSGGSAAPPLGFGQGVLLLWLNPKAWAMAFGAAGSFAGLTDEPGTLAVAFALAFGGAALVSMLLWCALGALLARALTAPWHWRVVNSTLAVLLVASILPLWLPL